MKFEDVYFVFNFSTVVQKTGKNYEVILITVQFIEEYLLYNNNLDYVIENAIGTFKCLAIKKKVKSKTFQRKRKIITLCTHV